MRDRFKFRAWEIDKEKYHYDVQDWYAFFVIDYPDKYIVEQCTGLKDKNGKLIYEGDILGGVLGGYIRWCDSCKSFQRFTPWEECMGCAGDVLWAELVEDDGKLEVVGNIHENPELLED